MHEAQKAALRAIEKHFHALIQERAGDLIIEHKVQLPRLAPPLGSESSKAWFPVPGMYGGFSYWLEDGSTPAKLMVESWCRVVSGSGERHEVTVDGYQLIDEGFV
jgi:hypothetical protein